jgi:hypothetical protein
MTKAEALGPFVNEDGDVWVPVTVGGISAARRVAGSVSYGGRMIFEGMEDGIQMTLHEWGDMGCESGSPRPDCREEQPCTWTGRTYHFREVE